MAKNKKEYPTVSSFPFWIKGTIDNEVISVPFLSGSEVNAYLETLDWGFRKMNFAIDCIITHDGEQVGKIHMASKHKH